MRKDENGEFWSVVGAIGAQYVGDVIANIANGATGAEIFSFRSTAGEYIAAGMTALIPGAGLARALVRNVATEVIVSVERHINGEKNSLVSSVGSIAFGTVADTGIEKVASGVKKYVSSKTPKNYSSYANQKYKKNPNISRQQIQTGAARSIRWGRRIGNALSSGVNFIMNAFKNAFS